MKRTRQSAFSLVELLTVISIITILVSLLLVALSSARAKSRQAACVNNLHQLGLGFTGFALDHEGKYPMDVPERLGGSTEYNESRLVQNTPFSRDFHHFAALSNEVPNVKIMVCPADKGRRPAHNYQTFTNENLSYWVNTKAVPHATLATLAGDWNVYNASGHSNSVDNLLFGREVHRRKGSVLFADGRVEITRALAIDAQLPLQPVAVTSPPTGSPATPVGAGDGRQQPTTVSPAPAPRPRGGASSPVGSGSTAETSAAKSPPGELARTNDAVNLPARAGQSRSPGGFRIARADTSEEKPVPERMLPADLVSPGGPPEPREYDDEPWNTPRFRMFKAFALLSYSISLIWALIALLLLYLRSRLAQREEERRAAATRMD